MRMSERKQLLRGLTVAIARHRAHMAGTGYELTKDKMDIRLWRENPLVQLNIAVHKECGQCYGFINECARKWSLHNVQYNLDLEEVKRWESARSTWEWKPEASQ